jgi:hypothetical protein
VSTNRRGLLLRMSWGLGLLLCPLWVGCASTIVGDWVMVEAVPNRQVFSISQASFKSDKTFSATTTIDGITTADKGTYFYDGFKLKLRPQSGGQRAYNVQFSFDRLQLADGNRKVVLRKGQKGT